jgi:hypothetical protein
MIASSLAVTGNMTVLGGVKKNSMEKMVDPKIAQSVQTKARIFS